MISVKDKEEEKEKRQEDINRLFGTDNTVTNNEPINNNINNSTYEQRMQDIQDLFRIRNIAENESDFSDNTSNSNADNMTVTTYQSENEALKSKKEEKENNISDNILSQKASMEGVLRSQARDAYTSTNKDKTGIKIVDTNVDNKSDSKTSNSSKEVITLKKTSDITEQDLINYQNQVKSSSYDNANKKISQNLKLGFKNTLMQIPYYMENEMMANVSGYEQKRTQQYLASNKVNDVDKQIYISAAKNRLLDNNGNNVSVNDLELETNLIVKDMEEKIDANQSQIERNIYSLNNPIDRKLAELTPSIGQMGLTTLISYVNPVLGATIFSISAAGGYVQDAKQRGMNRKDAVRYGTIMGIFEEVTEQFSVQKLLKGGKYLGVNDFINALKNYGISIADNFVQEAVIEPASELTATLTGGIETADWSNMFNRMWKAGFDGALLSAIMGGADAGVSSAVNLYNNLQNGKGFTEAELKKVIQDIQDNGNVDMEGIIEDTINGITNANNVGIFYISNFNQDGEVVSLDAVQGKRIPNPNENININPAIVINNVTDTFNVVDINTGVLLDNSPYQSLSEAQVGFNSKILNADSAMQKSINNKIVQANIALNNKAIQIESEAQGEMISSQSINNNTSQNVQNATQTGANNVNVNQNNINTSNVNQNINTDANIDQNNPYQTSQNEFRGNVNGNTSNYASNGLNEVSKLISQISDNSVYGKDRVKAILRIVNKNIPTIEVQTNGNTTYLNSLDSDGSVALQQPIANRPYTGGQLKEIVNNAVNRADLSEINTAQTIENEFRDISNANTVNYVSQNRNENVGQNNEQIRNNNSNIPRIYEQQINNYKQKSAQLNNINGDVVEINTNIFEDISKKKQSSFLNEYLRYEVKGNDYFVDGEKIIANSTTTGKLKNGHTNFDKRIEVNLRNELKANIIGNLDNIVKHSKLYQADKPDTKNHTFADTFDRRRTLVKYNNYNYEVMFEIGKKNNINTLYGIESIKRTNKNRLSLPKLTSKKGLQNTNKIVDGSHKSNTSIPQNKQSVKNNTSVNNKSMQNNKNNTSRSEKVMQEELHNRIQNALLSKNSRKNTFLGTVSDKVVNKVKSLLGIDVSGRRHMLSDNDIRHMIKEHGNPAIEKTKGQIAITTKDIEKIPDIINNYDNIIKGNDNKQGQTIRYIKNYTDNRTYVVEVIPNANDKTLYIKTMWKKPITLTNSQKTPSSTSKTRGNSSSSTSSKSIPQNSQNVKDNGIRAERTSNTTEYDNQGNKLTKAQRDFFKDSKVRDENGNLLVMYHGTEANVGLAGDYWFTIFDIDRAGSHGNMLGDGFYFTSNKQHAEQYAHTKGHIYETYLDIKRPLELQHFSTGDLVYTIRNINPYIEADIYKRDGSIDGYKVRKYLKDNGYDGIHSGNTYVVFDSNQIKNITNSSPTSNPDIRYEKTSNTTSKPYDARIEEKKGFVEHINKDNYLKQLMEVDNYQGETYAHSFERRIEQEIQNVQSLGAFDNSIPITKLSDIDKLVEDFLGTKVMKGHFRQRARGIYNTKTDTIRVKELKDMDNVLHEMGHALDLGGRIKIDKATIANELLDAVNRHGGYENESRSIQLDEGFAEVVKEYAINPAQARLDYPQTYAVLEAERQQNIKFNDFMAKLQNQIYNYIHQNPQNRLLSNMSIGEQTDKKPTTVKAIESKIVQTVWDRDFEVKRLANEMEKSLGRKLNPSENIYLLTRLASGTSNKIISMLSKGYIDENGNRMMPGLNRIGEILGNDPQRMNDLRAYLVAKRDLEYKAKSLKTGIRTMDSKEVVERFYNDAQIQEAAQVVYDTLDGVLQYAVNNGLITQDTAKSLRESNVFYVPFQRVITGRSNQTGRRGAVSDVINQRTGSELDIKDVFENIIANSANMIQQVENNNILRTLANEGIEAGANNGIFEQIAAPMKKIGTARLSTWETELKNQGVDTSELDLEKTIDLFVPNNDIIVEKDGSRVVSYFDTDGTRKYLQFFPGTDDIFNGLMGLDKNGNSAVLRLMRNLNMPLRYGATMANIGFAIPNMISDTIQATIYSEAGFIPVVDNVLGVLDILGATNKTARKFLNAVAPQYAERINRIYDIYQQTGASSATRMNQYRESTQKVMKDIYGTKNSEVLGIKESFKPLKRFMDLLTYIPELSESSTRFRVFERNYNASLRKGMSETDARVKAAIESRDATQDFGRTGTFMGEVNKLIPFSAARVGSAYTFAEKIKANPKRTSARIAVLVVASLAIKALGYDDEEIEELNQRKKDDNFVIKIGNTVFTIKKPQGILRSIINLAEYTQDLATGHIEEGKELERLTSWLNNAIMDNMPADEISGLVPSAIAPLIENSLNKDFYYNTDIVKSWDLDLPNSEQYYDYNSQLAIWLGKIFNYSPAKIDNLFSGWFGGLGTDITGAIDWVSAKMGLSAEKPAMGAEDNAVGKRFVVNVNENSASIDEIYDREEELTKKLNGGTITEEENAELENIKAGISKLSALNKQIKAIKQDLTMSGTEKADAIRPLQQQKTDVARQALGKEPIYTENTDELEALEFYPSRSTLSYNGLTLNMTEEMKREYMDTAYELYQRYAKQGLYSEQYLEVLKTKIKDAAKKTMIQKYRSQLIK